MTLKPPPDQDIVVVGATGDLAQRKLLPALYYRFCDGQIPDTSRVIAAARSDLSDESYRHRAMQALQRQRVLRQIAAGIHDRKEEFARIMTLEAGKSIKASRSEVDRAIFTFTVAAEESSLPLTCLRTRR